MKKTRKIIPSFFLFNCIFLLLSTLLFTSCTDKEEMASKELRTAHKASEVPCFERFPAAEESAEAPYPKRSPALEAPLTKKYEEYKVELGADALMKIPGIPGELRVWIGVPDYESNFPENMSQASGTLPAVGKTARVAPFAPGFVVEPKESICMKIHPRGSEVRFKLTPTKKGIFKVGADVYLFDSDDCSGTPIPKAAATLRVEVVVDTFKVIQEHTKKLWEVFWEKLLDFWGAVIALFFAVLLFLIRGRLKKLFGYEDDR